jgi:transglutaminase superfamily protein
MRLQLSVSLASSRLASDTFGMSSTTDELLAYYATPGAFTALDGFESQVEAIPDDIAAIAGVVQGLLIHHALAPAYQVVATPERTEERELHAASAMLACAARLDGRPLNQTRTPDRRVMGVCRHFATLFVAIARHKRIPSRVRCGFADYFDPAKHAEHWVAEYWRADQQRWVLVDAQIDAVQQRLFRPDFDTLDVPRDRFLVAGDAWRACRNGADPMTFGVAGTPMWGLVEVFGELFQDLAALQKIELLPWGWYGLAKDESAMERELPLLDHLAALSSAADAPAIEELRAVVAGDDRLRVPPETLTALIAADQEASPAFTHDEACR